MSAETVVATVDVVALERRMRELGQKVIYNKATAEEFDEYRRLIIEYGKIKMGTR